MSLGETMLVGRYKSYDLKRAFRYRTYRMKSCYRNILRTRPDIGGTVTALFSVSAEGRVTSAAFSAFDASVASCARDMLLPTKFPKVTEELRARVVFKFRPNWRFGTPKGQRNDRVVLGAQDADAPSSRCTKRTRFVLRGAPLAAVRRCRSATTNRAVRMTAVFDVDAAGAVSRTEMRGVEDGEFPGCVGEALRGVRFAAGGSRRVACTLGFGATDSARAVDESVRLDIGRADVRVGRFKAGEAMDLTSPLPGVADPGRSVVSLLRLRRWEQQYLDGRGVAARGRSRLAIHAHPGVEGTALTKILGMVRPIQFASVYYTRAVGTSDMWQAVNPLGTPSWLCSGARAAITVTVTSATLVVTEAGGKIHTLERTKGQEIAALRGLLTPMRGRAGPDIDIVATNKVAYRELLNVLEAVVQVGYFDARIVVPDDV